MCWIEEKRWNKLKERISIGNVKTPKEKRIKEERGIITRVKKDIKEECEYETEERKKERI